MTAADWIGISGHAWRNVELSSVTSNSLGMAWRALVTACRKTNQLIGVLARHPSKLTEDRIVGRAHFSGPGQRVHVSTSAGRAVSVCRIAEALGGIYQTKPQRQQRRRNFPQQQRRQQPA